MEIEGIFVEKQPSRGRSVSGDWLSFVRTAVVGRQPPTASSRRATRKRKVPSPEAFHIDSAWHQQVGLMHARAQSLSSSPVHIV